MSKPAYIATPDPILGYWTPGIAQAYGAAQKFLATLSPYDPIEEDFYYDIVENILV
jgi:hypothetical protein